MLCVPILLALAVSWRSVHATLSPSYPEPGTVWTVGKEYVIQWEEDKVAPTIAKAWDNVRIDLMTGDNLDQIVVANIANNVSGSDLKFKYTAPLVEPQAPVYFIMFTNSDGENAWTSRFAIAEQGKKPVEAEKPIQPDGDQIPWGIGKLLGSGSQVNTANAESGLQEEQMIAAAALPSSASASLSSPPSGASGSSMPSMSHSSRPMMRNSAVTFSTPNPWLAAGLLLAAFF